MKKSIATLLVAVSAFAMNANAADFRPYMGIDYNYNNGNVNNFNSGTLNVGTQFNDYFGTEIFYQKSDNDVKTYGFSRQETRDFNAYGIDLNGYLPMGCEQEFALIGSVGVGEYEFNTGYNVATILNNRDHGIGYRFGLGGLYNITDSVAVKAMARYVKFDKLDSDTEQSDMMEYTAGIRYNF